MISSVSPISTTLVPLTPITNPDETSINVEPLNSELPGFYKKTPQERIDILSEKNWVFRFFDCRQND